LGAEVGKGKWKERVDSRGDFDPADLRDEINRTKAEAVKGFLQQAATHLGIPQYVLRDLYLSRDGTITYLQADVQRCPFANEIGTGHAFTIHSGNLTSETSSIYNTRIPCQRRTSCERRHEKQVREIAGGNTRDTAVGRDERASDDSLPAETRMAGSFASSRSSFSDVLIDTDLLILSAVAEYRLLAGKRQRGIRLVKWMR
jgi:hypothetical protein